MVEIPLTRGLVCKVDDQDADLAEHKWRAMTKGLPYVVRTVRENGRRVAVYMHVLIMMRMAGDKIEKGLQVDHVNGDQTDNRRSNLRLATRSQNLANSRLRSDNSTGFKGVHFNKAERRYIASISKQGRRHHLGYYDTAEEAHKAYLTAAQALFGEFARGK